MAKIKLVVSASIEETFSDFIISKKTKGLAEKTLQNYQSQFQAVARHMDVKMDIAMLQKADLDAMIISMRDASLSPNSINSYTRTLKSFFSWCNEQGITRLNIPLYKAEETVKETYSDAELAALLKKPDIRKATFSLQLYNLGGDPVAEGFIMLYEQDRRLESQKQLFNLHSGNHIDVIHRLVPDMKMLGLADGAGQQDFLFLPGA